METQKIKTAVVILNWNGKNWLEKFLANIISNSTDSEIISADKDAADDAIKGRE